MFGEFISSAIYPKINNEILNSVLIRIYETLFLATLSWLISIVLGIIFGILSSNIFYKFIKLPIFIKVTLRIILNIIRSFHELIWCLILMQIFGISKSIGVLSICIPFTAINAKVIREQLELISSKTIVAITQIKGNNFASLITLIWSPIYKTLKNFGIYRFECSIRSIALLGLFGIGGIGTSIFLSFQAFNFREMWTYIFSLAILIKISSTLLKRFRINEKFLLFFFTFSIFVILFLVSINLNLFFSDFILKLKISNLSLFLNSIYVPNNYFQAIYETITLSIFSTAIAISLPPLLLLISQNKYFIFTLKIIAFWLRVIPPPILILILLMFNNPSISLGAFTLGLHNAAITFKLLIHNLGDADNSNYDAMKSLGCSNRVSWLCGLFSEQSKSYLSYCAYRSDILIRETAIVGVIGSIGLGWKLNEAITSFAWSEVFIILFAYSVIAILGELINGKIKSILI